MGSLPECDIVRKESSSRKVRVLCLHGFRTSGEILRKQLEGKWPECVTARFDFVYPDAPFMATGKSSVEGLFPPPYFEWLGLNEAWMDYKCYNESLAYIEDFMIKHGPFDGLLGFSQGGILAAALPGLQAKGLALTRVPKVKFVIIISGSTFLTPVLVSKAFSQKIGCKSLHFIGQKDFLKKRGELLSESFIDPEIIYHPKGHTIPRLEENDLETVLRFVERIETDIYKDEGKAMLQ